MTAHDRPRAGAGNWLTAANWLAGLLWASLRDLLPVVCVIATFQTLVFRQPLENLGQLLLGMLAVVIGLTLFLVGLQLGLFPIGEQMAHAFAHKGNVAWLLLFAFSLGFGTTFAEPALISISSRAADLAVSPADASVAEPDPATAKKRETYSWILRSTVACSVGFALVLGVLRILFGWPLHYLIMFGYFLVMTLTAFAPKSIVAIAYDAGGVTTSTITVPLTAALGVGLASSIRGRDPLLDGFGLIAFASLTPILFVLALGILWS